MLAFLEDIYREHFQVFFGGLSPALVSEWCSYLIIQSSAIIFRKLFCIGKEKMFNVYNCSEEGTGWEY